MSDVPCIGCGWCCMTDPCDYSHRKYGQLRRCPDLYWDPRANRYFCGLMGDAEQGVEVRRQNFEGQGCCAPLNPWRADVRNRDGEQT